MGTFKEYITEKAKIYRNEKVTDWSFDGEAKDYAEHMGNTICTIGESEENIKSGRSNIFVFMYLGRNEATKGKEFSEDNKNKDEELVRYITRATAAGGMAPLCILNVAKGYMRIMENIDDDPEIEDAKWSKPVKFRYIRSIY